MTPYERAEWERVAICEEGGNWAYDGPLYSGGLGISRANWVAYGGLRFALEGAEATKDEQIEVGMAIEGDGHVPDQGGCAGW